MKKILMIALCVLLAVVFVGCSAPISDQVSDFRNIIAGLGAVSNELEGMPSWATFPTIISVMAEDSGSMIGIPESIFENDEFNFFSNSTVLESNPKYSLAIVTPYDSDPIELEINVINKKIYDVKYKMDKDTFTSLDAIIFEGLVEDFGEPSSIKLNDESSSIDEIKEYAESGNSMYCAISWYSNGYTYQCLIEDSRATQVFTIF